MKQSMTRPSVLVPAALLAASMVSRRMAPFGLDGGISRKRLVALGGLGLGALATAGWRSRAADAASSATTSGALCVLSPEQTQGPYYIAKEKVRSNIAEKRPGTPLLLRLTVLDATTCAPLKGATVDIWHCDATGVYSGFESASAGANGGGNGGPPGGGAGPTDHDTFLRGIQPTDARGICQFLTIYPGWYTGRTVHIHVMVHTGGTIVHTGQLYIADSLTDTVYQSGPYKARAAGRDTRNSGDNIYAGGGAQSTLTMKRTSTGGYSGTITLGVRHV